MTLDLDIDIEDSIEETFPFNTTAELLGAIAALPVTWELTVDGRIRGVAGSPSRLDIGSKWHRCPLDVLAASMGLSWTELASSGACEGIYGPADNRHADRTALLAACRLGGAL